jgi:hypothetical protein
MTMRNLVFILVVASAAACTPYDPTLPATPFSCGSGDPQCPDGYTCMQTDSRNLCVNTSGPDAGMGVCADDHNVEPNDSPSEAYSIPTPLAQNPFTLAGLAICPYTDKDFYSFAIQQDQTNLEFTMVYDTGAALTMSVLNSTGATIANTCPGPVSGTSCTANGSTVTIKISNAALGSSPYIVEIAGPGTQSGAGSGTNNYKLMFATTN